MNTNFGGLVFIRYRLIWLTNVGVKILENQRLASKSKSKSKSKKTYFSRYSQTIKAMLETSHSVYHVKNNQNDRNYLHTP